jgi:predicted nucleic acid-binding protein
MNGAFVDSSVLLAIAFNESTADRMRARLRESDALFASPLAEAEVRSAAKRESKFVDSVLFGALKWVHPQRALTTEIRRVLDAGYVRGADCWHLATALYFVEDPSDFGFLTLDKRQQEVAIALGFIT